MNIIEALYISSLSPEKIGVLIIDMILGFENRNIRKITYYDIFILMPFYLYNPAQIKFKRLKFDKNNSFYNMIERHPEIFVNIEERYLETIKFVKNGFIYLLQNNIIKMNDNLELKLLNNKYKVTNKELFKMAQVFSTRTTAELYNFFKVDIDAI